MLRSEKQRNFNTVQFSEFSMAGGLKPDLKRFFCIDLDLAMVSVNIDRESVKIIFVLSFFGNGLKKELGFSRKQRNHLSNVQIKADN